MIERTDVVRIRPFPLEAEAIAAMAQCELAHLQHEELLKYSQQATLVMSQLRHYASELISALEERGYSLESEEKSG